MKAGVKRFETLAGKTTEERVVYINRRYYVRLELINLPGTAPPQ